MAVINWIYTPQSTLWDIKSNI